MARRPSPPPTPPAVPMSTLQRWTIKPVSDLAWAIIRLVVLYPVRAAGLTVAITALTPVTVREVAGVAVGVAAVPVIEIFWGAGRRGARPSLPEITKFRQRRNLLRRRWVTVNADCGLAKASVYGGPDKRRPRLCRVQQAPLGVVAVVDGSPVSASVTTFTAVADKLRAGFKARSIKISARRGRIHLYLRYDDPTHFTRPLPVAGLPTATKPLHVVVGLDEDGHPVQKDLRLPGLIIGAPGSGKSSEIAVTLHQIQQAGIPYRVRVFDPKGGQEFAEFEDAAWRYERNPLAWPDFVSTALSALSARQEALRRARLRKNVFTWANPLDIMIVDELLTALAFETTAKVKYKGRMISATAAFKVYLSQCRSAGYTCLALTQLGQKDVIGDIRGLFGYNTLLRVPRTESALVDIVLGTGAHNLYPAHLLDAGEHTAGTGWYPTDAGVVKYRAAYLTDAERAGVVARMAQDCARLRAAARFQVRADDEAAYWSGQAVDVEPVFSE